MRNTPFRRGTTLHGVNLVVLGWVETPRPLWDNINMKSLPLIFLAFWALPALAADKLTTVTVDGTTYSGIQDAHIVTGGRVVLIYPSGGTTVTPDKLPKDFLDSWGITLGDVQRSKAAAEKQAEHSLEQSIRAGYFREVEGVVYDMRKPQAGWVRFTGAKILQAAGDGALIDPNPGQADPTAIFVRNLPQVFTDNDPITVMAKLTGTFSYANKFNFERTIRAYDAGRICKRSEIPDAILKEGAAAAALADAPKPRTHFIGSLPGAEWPHATGSGFFVTRDGYLLTNFHVVKDAEKIQVKYKSQFYKATVVNTDKQDDLAVLKVDGGSFPRCRFRRGTRWTWASRFSPSVFPTSKCRVWNPNTPRAASAASQACRVTRPNIKSACPCSPAIPAARCAMPMAKWSASSWQGSTTWPSCKSRASCLKTLTTPSRPNRLAGCWRALRALTRSPPTAKKPPTQSKPSKTPSPCS